GRNDWRWPTSWWLTPAAWTSSKPKWTGPGPGSPPSSGIRPEPPRPQAPMTQASMTQDRRGLVAAAVFGLLLAGTVIAGSYWKSHRVAAEPSVVVVAYTRIYSGDHRTVPLMMARGDGQAYASIGQDPALRRPGVWPHGPRQEALWAHRPLLPYLAALGGVGGRSGVERAQLVLVLL